MGGENWTFWLNMTNFALGIVTLLAVVVVAGAVSWDLFFMWLRKVRTGDAVDIRGINMQRLMAEVRAGWGAMLTAVGARTGTDHGGWWREDRGPKAGRKRIATEVTYGMPHLKTRPCASSSCSCKETDMDLTGNYRRGALCLRLPIASVNWWRKTRQRGIPALIWKKFESSIAAFVDHETCSVQRLGAVELHERQLPLLRFIPVTGPATSEHSRRKTDVLAESLLAGSRRKRTLPYRH